MFHLHRLDRDERLALRHRVTGRHQHLRHDAWHRRLETALCRAALATPARGLAFEHEVRAIEPHEAPLTDRRDLGSHVRVVRAKHEPARPARAHRHFERHAVDADTPAIGRERFQLDLAHAIAVLPLRTTHRPVLALRESTERLLTTTPGVASDPVRRMRRVPPARSRAWQAHSRAAALPQAPPLRARDPAPALARGPRSRPGTRARSTPCRTAPA